MWSGKNPAGRLATCSSDRWAIEVLAGSIEMYADLLTGFAVLFKMCTDPLVGWASLLELWAGLLAPQEVSTRHSVIPPMRIAFRMLKL